MSLNTNQKPIYAITPRTDVGVLDAATAGAYGATTNAVTVLTAGSNGTRVKSLLLNTNDTAAVNVFVMVVGSDGTTVKPLGIVNVPLTSGAAASVYNVDAFDNNSIKGLPLDSAGKRYFDLGPSETLRVSVLANMTAAKKCHATAISADY